jgi:hypothetical protein
MKTVPSSYFVMKDGGIYLMDGAGR